MAEHGDPSTWGAETIQLSFFVSAPHHHSATDLFRKIFNESPAASQENTHPQFGRVGTATAGAKNGRTCTIQLQPGRLDVLLHPSGEELPSGGFPAVENDVSRGLHSASSIALKGLADLTGVNRIAVNVRLTKFSNEPAESNAEIAKVLPIAMDLEGVRDFVLQVNKRASQDGIEFNRVLKWTCESMQILADGPSAPISGSAVLLREISAAVIHFDYNTVVPRPVFSTEEVKAAIKILADSLDQTRKSNLGF